MASLLAVLENRGEDAIALMESENIIREPEGLFYLARHCGMLNASGLAIQLVRRARVGGFWSSLALERDPAFTGIRNSPEFDVELLGARRLEQNACQMFREACGQAMMPIRCPDLCVRRIISKNADGSVDIPDERSRTWM